MSDASDDSRQSEHDKIRAEINKLIAESIKLGAETSKINAEARWYPFVAVAGIFAAAFALVKYVL